MNERPNPSHWELGSEFHWLGLPQPPLHEWHRPAACYMLARHAIADLLRATSAGRRALWLPTYFCPEVAEICRDICAIREYRDSPEWDQPDWDSLRPNAGDVVLAVNYFGVRTGESWNRWHQDSRCVLLEDHSQDPFSGWAVTSNADFVVVSARKTLPIPDGALLWSPAGRELPTAPADGDWSGVALKAAALTLKAEYLRGNGGPELKATFREFQLRGEQMFRKSRISAISPPSLAYVAAGVPVSWRKQRAKNARYLQATLANATSVKCLFSGWQEGAVPFAFPILFTTEQERDECQSWLRQNHIYCPVHWAVETPDRDALALSKRILSLPVDQRYSESDMDRIVEAVAAGRAQKTRVEVDHR